jgi:hypothetical protein
MKEYQSTVACETCSELADRVFTPVQISVFNPYVEVNFNGKPIEVTSKRQRDELCAKHHVTYDSTQYMRRPKRQSAVDNLDYAVVKRSAERGKLDDGTPIESPVMGTESLDD